MRKRLALFLVRTRPYRFLLHYGMAVDLLHQYGERATPSAVSFVWTYVAPDWDAVEKYVEAGWDEWEKERKAPSA